MSEAAPTIYHLQSIVPLEMCGMRLDQALAALFPDHSRSRMQGWIRAGAVVVDNRPWEKPKARLFGGEKITIQAEQRAEVAFLPQPIPLELLYQDRDLIIVNKPAGLVVHPAAGNPDGTLQNALLHLDPELCRVPRAGIVHRLDKETSGIVMIARTPEAHTALVAQLQARTIRREYVALAQGRVVANGRIDQPIGRHPTQRLKMAVVAGGKAAVTHYQVSERFAAHSWLRVRLESGRTHQIRVHLAHLRHPLVGDPLYGGRLRIPAGCSPALRQQLLGFSRQALHAQRLGLIHPRSGEALEWQSEIPQDLQQLLTTLREEEGHG